MSPGPRVRYGAGADPVWPGEQGAGQIGSGRRAGLAGAHPHTLP